MKVAPATKKITEERLTWHGHVNRRDEADVLGRMLHASVPGQRWRGRQKTRWKDPCTRDMDSDENALDRTKWKIDIQYYHSGDPS